jgi:hypothetical protein
VSSDRLENLLREVATPQATEARERAVAEARAEVATRTPDRSGARVLVSLAAGVLLVVVVLLTPPGRAASAWVGELVGIGDVGGPPTREDRGPGTSQEVVIDNGRAPDGTRYEWVAYRCEFDMREQGQPDVVRGIGVSLEWPGAQGPGGGGSCEEGTGAHDRDNAFTSHGVHILPSQFKGAERPGLVISGSTGPSVHRVKIVYTDSLGETHELPIDFTRVEGKLRELAHRSEALGTFMAFIPGDWAARDELVSRLDLRALYGTPDFELGPLGRRERAQAREAFETCEPLAPDPNSLPLAPDKETLERAFAPQQKCMEEHLPPSPIEYVAYDEQGRELERMDEPLIAYTRPPTSPEDVAGREQPGDVRGRRPSSPGESEPVVLLRGRAPEGALYEVYSTYTEEDGTAFGHCVTTWWPYVRQAAASGSCGPAGLPPETAFGRRDAEQVAAKPYGFLSALPAQAGATRYWVLDGYARPNVSRVEVRYRDRKGGWHDAPVDLAQVGGAELERARADTPFGMFVAFVPASVDRCREGRRKRCEALEVIAYGADGRELSRVKHGTVYVDGA